MSEVVNVGGKKWHRVWWPKWMAEQGVVLLHAGGFYRPDRHERRPRADVPTADLCRVCFRAPTEGESA